MSAHALLVSAAVLAVVTGIVHSLLGERLIFQHLRESTLIPSLPAPPLKVRNVRILWATWHITSVLGWAFAGLLWQLANNPSGELSASVVLGTAAAAFLASAVLVLVGTRARHPGWVALGAVGVLSWMAAHGA
jgi:hypothetical protein